MRRSGHSRLFVTATVVWVAFWVAGLPSYYQQYSAAAMVWSEGILLLALLGLVYYVLGKVPRERRRSAASWIAFYFTIPLAFYDWLYCGVYLGHGVAFLWRYWYLTTYYVLPWLVLPGMAWILNSVGVNAGREMRRHPTTS